MITLTPFNTDALDRLKKAGPLFEEAVHALLNKSALMVISVAKQTAPSDRSTLRNSIDKGPVVKKQNTYSIEVGSNVEYAPYQEFGTGIYGPKKRPIYPRNARVLAFRARSGQMVFAKSVSGVKPKKFMQAGIKAVADNPNIAFAEADKVIAKL